MPDTSPKVFISYSQDSKKHKDLVLDFSNALRIDWIDTELDQYYQDEHHGMRWSTWCELQLRPDVSRFVLMVCTPTYKERVDASEKKSETGKGAHYEGEIIREYICDEKGHNERIIPILLGDNDKNCIPTMVSGFPYYAIRKPFKTCPGYEDLLAHLKGKSRIFRAPLGGVPPAQRTWWSFLKGLLRRSTPPTQSTPITSATSKLPIGEFFRRKSWEKYTAQPKANVEAMGTDLENSRHISILPAMQDWACDPKANPFAVLLGEYGMGKTWNSQLLARALASLDTPSTPFPMYFDLRRVLEDRDSLLSGDMPTVETLLDKLSARQTQDGNPAPSGRAILHAVQHGGALLIFDGLDEVLAHKRDDAWGQSFIDLLYSALPYSCWPKHLNKKSKSEQPGKILLTCRTHYFKSVQTQNYQILGQKRKTHHARAWLLLPFSEEEILKYFKLHLPDRDPQAVFDLLDNVHNLTEVSSRPQGLKMVSPQTERIEAAKREGKTVNSASIYALMVEEWLTRNDGRHRLLVEDKPILMQDLALFMWQKGLREISWERLAKWFREWLRLDPLCQKTPDYQDIPEESLLTDLRNATFLVRPGEDAFAFAHTSILEYFLALRLHRSLEENDAATWDELNPSSETLGFLLQHQETCEPDIQKKVRKTLAAHLAQTNDEKTARQSWVELFLLAPKAWDIDTLDISGLNLEKRSIEGLQLTTLCAKDANLAESQWKRCRFQQSNWHNANARQITFERIEGGEADFRDANLRAAKWQNVYLRPRFEGANLEDFQAADCPTLSAEVGAVCLPPADFSAQQWYLYWHPHPDAINACAISTDGQTIVTASNDNTTRIWNAHGQCLHTLKGRERSVRACAISADGQTIVTASDDKTARIWNAHGQCLHTLKGHERSVSACAISADGQTIVTASQDNTAGIWNAHGQCLHTLTEHEDSVGACAISADGQTVVTASGNRIFYWARQGDEWLCTLQLHSTTGTRIWLDAHTQTLQIDGPEWPEWQLRNTTGQHPNLLGANIAALGPMGHERLANAGGWRFLPRDDITPQT